MFLPPSIASDPRTVLRQFKRGDVLTAEVVNALIVLATREVSGPTVRRHSRGWYVDAGRGGGPRKSSVAPVWAKQIDGSAGGVSADCSWRYSFWAIDSASQYRDDTNQLNRNADDSAGQPQSPAMARLPLTEYQHATTDQWKLAVAMWIYEPDAPEPYWRWQLMQVMSERPALSDCNCPE